MPELLFFGKKSSKRNNCNWEFVGVFRIDFRELINGQQKRFLGRLKSESFVIVYRYIYSIIRY